MASDSGIKTLESLVWSIADILRGDFKRSEYGRIVLPFVVLRRLDCLLETSKEAVLEARRTLPKKVDDATREAILFGAVGAKAKVYNLSRFTFVTLKGQDPSRLHDNLVSYIAEFSAEVRDIFFEKFRFADQLRRLNDSGILWQVFERFAAVNLHPKAVSNIEMGYLFEGLIRRFSEISNETAGEHFTPREVVRLIVELLIVNDKSGLTGRGVIRRVYDPACGTGGMLTLAEETLKGINSGIRVELFGQELNGESFAICKSDMLVTGHDPARIAFGNTLTDDAHPDRSFHYMLSNPPYGVDWKKYQGAIKDEAKTLGLGGRFGAGTPRISDGQLLFLQHMIAKMRNDEAGSRIGIVMNGSPLFAGGAGAGESEIRRWMLENDWVEAIIALPTDMFYNTGIQTYVWLLTNRKSRARAGKTQLIDASGERFWKPMRKSLGAKRREIPDEARKEILRLYAGSPQMGGNEDGKNACAQVFDCKDFGYRELRIERPLRLNFQASPKRIARLQEEKAFLKLTEEERNGISTALLAIGDNLHKDRRTFDKALSRVLKAENISASPPVRKSILSSLSERDETAAICVDRRGKAEPDPELRDYERVPLGEDWREYVAKEVIPFVPDAWVDESYRDEKDDEIGRVGYEINFNRYFHRYVPPRPLEEIDAELQTLEAEITELLKTAAR